MLCLLTVLFFDCRCWSSLLDVATDKAARKACQWWFHIYNSLEQFRAREEGHEVNGRGT